MQNPFPSTSVPKDRRCGTGFAKRTESALCDHVSDALYFTTVHDTFRSVAVRLQRSSVYI